MQGEIIWRAAKTMARADGKYFTCYSWHSSFIFLRNDQAQYISQRPEICPVISWQSAAILYSYKYYLSLE
jgi:hypothetical protein